MSDTSVIFNILARDNASGTFGKVGKAMLAVAGGVVGGAAIMNGVSKAFDFAKQAAIGFNGELEQSDIAFTTMLGSGQKSKRFLDELQSFAKSTPFEFSGLVHNAQNMMGMGIAARDVIPDLRALGDSVASIGGGAQQVDSVTLAFDQMNAKGTLDMGNMNQLMQNGVPSALKVLAASYRVTTGDMIKMISTGKVQSADALPRLIAGIEKGTSATAALGGMMDKQSRTFSGAMSNIGDSLTQAAAGAFKPFFGLVSGGAQRVAGWLSSPAFSEFGDRVSAGIKTGIAWAGKFISGFNFRPVIAALTTVWSVITKDLVPAIHSAWTTFGPLVITIGQDLYGALQKAFSLLGPTGAVIKDVFGFVADHATAFRAIAIAIGTVVVATKAWTLATTIWSSVTKIATGVQWLLNVAMDANPVGIIVLAVLALAGAFVYLWTHSKAFRDFFIGLWSDIWGFIKPIGQWFAGPFASFFVTAWHAIAGAGLWLWHNVLDPIWQGISTGIGFVMRIITSLINLWLYLGSAIFAPVYRGIIKPAIDGIGTAVMWLWHNVLEPTGKLIGIMVKAAGETFTWLYDNAIHPAFKAIAAAANWAWNTILHPMFKIIMKVVDDVGGKFKKVFNAIGGFISGAFHDAVGIVKGVINSIIDMINGAIKFINKDFIATANKVPGVNFPMIPTLPHLYTGGDITRGGMVMVGERGPEPVILPAGARVLPHGAAAGGPARVVLAAAPGDQVAELLLALLRPVISHRYGGDVQVAIGGH